MEPTFAIRSRAKITLSTNCTFYIREHSISKNITDYPTKSTYVMYLTILMSTMSLSQKPKKTDSTPDPPENGEIFISPNSTPPTPTNYERIISHASEVRFINNRYTTPITVEFGSSESKNSVTLPIKYRKIFFVVKILDPLTFITIKVKVITNPLEFPMGTEYTELFDVITDQNIKFPLFFVHHDLHSTLNVSTMKYG